MWFANGFANVASLTQPRPRLSGPARTGRRSMRRSPLPAGPTGRICSLREYLLELHWNFTLQRHEGTSCLSVSLDVCCLAEDCNTSQAVIWWRLPPALGCVKCPTAPCGAPASSSPAAGRASFRQGRAGH